MKRYCKKESYLLTFQRERSNIFINRINRFPVYLKIGMHHIDEF